MERRGEEIVICVFVIVELSSVLKKVVTRCVYQGTPGRRSVTPVFVPQIEELYVLRNPAITPVFRSQDLELVSRVYFRLPGTR